MKYPTLYQYATSQGAVECVCIECEKEGEDTKTIHPLRLCRKHFAWHFYQVDHLADLPTWDSANIQGSSLYRPKSGTPYYPS